MYIIDISRDIFKSPVYKGDPEPEYEWITKIEYGEDVDISYIKMCTHTGTHIDAPAHYIKGGATVDQLPLSKFYGDCTVVTISGVLTGEDMETILPFCKKKLILKGEGNAYLSPSAAIVIADYQLDLIGTDGMSICDMEDDYVVHRTLLLENIVILEGLDLTGIEDGNYKISAFPLKLVGLEASPVRAILFKQEYGI